jgi:hypothetical protein
VIVLILGILSPFALASSTIPPELQAEADKAGINTEGLTKSNVKIKLQKAWNAEFREKVQKYSIDTTNLSDEQVRE